MKNPGSYTTYRKMGVGGKCRGTRSCNCQKKSEMAQRGSKEMNDE